MPFGLLTLYTCDDMKILLEAIRNNVHQRNICRCLNVTGILIGEHGVLGNSDASYAFGVVIYLFF
jgi:hypothetical protein